MKSLFFILGLLSLPFGAIAATEEDYLRFFNDFQARAAAFDVSFVEHYTDEATIRTVRKMNDGSEKTLSLPGKRWKALIRDSIDIARQRDDRSDFSEVKVELNEQGATIRAQRYSRVKCYQDTAYYMVVSPAADGQLQVVEEYMETLAVPACAQGKENDLSLVLQAAVEHLRPQLPLELDHETRLVGVEARGKLLILNHELRNYSADTVKDNAFTSGLQPALEKQACEHASYQGILAQGGAIRFIYTGQDQKPLTTVTVEASACGD